MSRDNSKLFSKLKLRRHFLNMYHRGDSHPRVLDCCQGSGVIWDTLRKEFDIGNYLGVDLKAKTGRLTIDSKKLLTSDTLNYDIIDVDVYGQPWEHYEAALPHIKKPTTFFLTLGSAGVGYAPISKLVARRVDFFLDKLEFQFGKTLIEGQIIPPAIFKKVITLGIDYCLAEAWRYGLRVINLMESSAGPTAQYFGVRVEPD